MEGETDLAALINGMKPELQPGEYVFCSVPAYQVPPGIQPICLFQEAEGTTLILSQPQADRLGLPYDFVAAWISLTVHSSLAAVGLTAVVSQRLAAAGISCNVVAAYYHDHLFVDIQNAPQAIALLSTLESDSIGTRGFNPIC